MSHCGIPQFPLRGSQTSEGNSSTAPQAKFSNTASQFSQYNRRPESQRMPLGRSRPLLDLLPSLAHCSDPPCPQSSASHVHSSSSAPSHTLGHPQQYPASLESRISPPYTASQMSNPYPLRMICVSGVEGSRSGHVLHSHNGDGFPLTSMVDSGLQTAQMAPVEPYNSGAEQSNEQIPNVLSGMGSWASRQVPGRARFSNNHHTSDGMRH